MMNIQRSRGRRQQHIAEINVVPYIDVMLVLLVIFMILLAQVTSEEQETLSITSSSKILI